MLLWTPSVILLGTLAASALAFPNDGSPLIDLAEADESSSYAGPHIEAGDNSQATFDVGTEHPEAPNSWPDEQWKHPGGAHKYLKKTIYQVLEDDPRFNHTFKLVNFTQDITGYLNNTDANVTFFAPSNAALKPRHAKIRHSLRGYGAARALHTEELFGDIHSHLDESESIGYDVLNTFSASVHGAWNDPTSAGDLMTLNISRFLSSVLLYHILPTALSVEDLTENTTFATNLTLPRSLDNEALRLRVGTPLILLAPTINLYAKIRSSVVTANGIIHEIDHLLIPPPSIFESLFLIPDAFSTLTSALGRVGLIDSLDLRYTEGGTEGTSSVTVFAPTNKAFKKLPRRLQFYLFAPIGQKALKKLLQFHIVPDLVFHSDWVHNASNSEVLDEDLQEAEMMGDIGFFDAGARFQDGLRSVLVDEADHSRHERCKGPGMPRRVKRGGRPLLHCSPRDVPLAMAQKLGFFASPHPDGSACLYMPGPEFDTETGSLLEHDRPRQPSSDIKFCTRGRSESEDCDCNSPLQPASQPRACRNHEETHDFPGHGSLVYSLNVTVPTLLTNHTLNVHAAQYKHKFGKTFYNTLFLANGQAVRIADIVARDGALHVVNNLLHPLKHHSVPESSEDIHVHSEQEEDDWEDWEEWLPRWADED